MGLDIYFYRRNENKYNEAKQKTEALSEHELADLIRADFFVNKEASDEELVENYGESAIEAAANASHEEVAYFRKVNFLMDAFNYTGNCEYKGIDKCQIEQLISDCENELAGTESLNPTQGFFFGSTDKDEYFYRDVEEVKEKFEEILQNTDWENETIQMYCWW